MTATDPPDPPEPPDPDGAAGAVAPGVGGVAGDDRGRDDLAALAAWAGRRTPARVFTGRVGTSLRTATQLGLRADHAAARDAVAAEVDLAGPAFAPLVTRYGLFTVATQAGSHAEHLRRPDLGRRLSAEGRAAIAAACPQAADVQVVIGDGLSATAVTRQVPDLLPRLEEGFRRLGRTFGRPFLVRHCRVGVMNDVGDVLGPDVVVLLVGERPGLSTAESLSAYLAHRPRPGHTDADRNLVSNIHARGLPVPQAADAIVALAEAQRAARASGAAVKQPDAPPGLPGD